jgi:hypothetical protein
MVYGMKIKLIFRFLKNEYINMNKATLSTAKSGTGILIHINVFIIQRSKNEFDPHAVYLNKDASPTLSS